MKTLKCDLCEHVAEGETFEDWMNALKPHYMEVHAAVMKSHSGNPEGMKAAMGKWMEDNKARFDAV